MNEKKRFSGSEKSEEQRLWDEAAERVGRTVDTFEHPIDEGIREGVIALNLLDINTHGSCEGHLDRGDGAPYIDIAAKLSKDEAGRFKEFLRTKDQNKEEFKELKEDIDRMNLEEQRKIFAYLDDFYQNRNVPFHKRLIVGNVALGRLESQGARLQKIADETTKQERLKEYQEEMGAFIAFLRKKYFAGGK